MGTKPHQQLGLLTSLLFVSDVSQPIVEVLKKGQPIPVEDIFDHNHNLGEEPRGSDDAKEWSP